MTESNQELEITAGKNNSQEDLPEEPVTSTTASVETPTVSSLLSLENSSTSTANHYLTPCTACGSSSSILPLANHISPSSESNNIIKRGPSEPTAPFLDSQQDQCSKNLDNTQENTTTSVTSVPSFRYFSKIAYLAFGASNPIPVLDRLHMDSWNSSVARFESSSGSSTTPQESVKMAGTTTTTASKGTTASLPPRPLLLRRTISEPSDNWNPNYKLTRDCIKEMSQGWVDFRPHQVTGKGYPENKGIEGTNTTKYTEDKGTDDANATKILVKHLPNELLEKIMFKLPIKEFVLFGSLNKELRREALRCSEENSGFVFIGQQNNRVIRFLNLCQLDHHLLSSIRYSDCRVESLIDPITLLGIGHRVERIEIIGHVLGFICFTCRRSIGLWNPTSRAVEVLPPHGMRNVDVYGICCQGTYPFLMIGSGKRILTMDFRRGLQWRSKVGDLDISIPQLTNFEAMRGKHSRGSFYWQEGRTLIGFKVETESYFQLALEVQVHSIHVINDALAITVDQDDAFQVYSLRENNLEPILRVMKPPRCKDLHVFQWKEFITVAVRIAMMDFRVTEIHFFLDGTRVMRIEDFQEGFEDVMIVAKSTAPTLPRLN